MTRIRAGNGDVFATTTYVSVARAPPSSPSATAHIVPVSVVPIALVASIHGSPRTVDHHIDRSTTIGTVLLIMEDSDTHESVNVGSVSSDSPFTQTVWRLLAATG